MTATMCGHTWKHPHSMSLFIFWGRGGVGGVFVLLCMYWVLAHGSQSLVGLLSSLILDFPFKAGSLSGLAACHICLDCATMKPPDPPACTSPAQGLQVHPNMPVFGLAGTASPSNHLLSPQTRHFFKELLEPNVIRMFFK